MRVAYIRCSTIEQNEARQVKMMQEQKAEKMFIDKASGKNTDRAAFKEMMSFVHFVLASFSTDAPRFVRLLNI